MKSSRKHQVDSNRANKVPLTARSGRAAKAPCIKKIDLSMNSTGTKGRTVVARENNRSKTPADKRPAFGTGKTTPTRERTTVAKTDEEELSLTDQINNVVFKMAAEC